MLALPIGAGPGLGRTVIEEQQLIAVIKFNAINSGVNKNDKRRLLLRAPHVTANFSSLREISPFRSSQRGSVCRLKLYTIATTTITILLLL